MSGAADTSYARFERGLRADARQQALGKLEPDPMMDVARSAFESVRDVSAALEPARHPGPAHLRRGGGRTGAPGMHTDSPKRKVVRREVALAPATHLPGVGAHSVGRRMSSQSPIAQSPPAPGRSVLQLDVTRASATPADSGFEDELLAYWLERSQLSQSKYDDSGMMTLSDLAHADIVSVGGRVVQQHEQPPPRAQAEREDGGTAAS